MKTRLLWLGILCLALLIALGLLVVSAQELPLSPPQAQYLLPLLPSAQIAPNAADSAVCKPLWVFLRAYLPTACPAFRHLLASDANGIPLTGGSYADAAFAAFHFSDEAG